MSKFNKAMMITTVCMVICLLVVFYAVFSVFSSSIEKLIIQDFANDAHMNYMILDASIDKCKNGITSMESRTAIRHKTLDHLDGSIERESLSLYVQNRYREGVYAIDNLVVSQRFLPDKTLLCGVEEDNGRNYLIEEINFSSEVDYNNCVQTDDNLILYSAFNVLNYEEDFYGYEYLVFDLTEEIGNFKTYEIFSYVKDNKSKEKIIDRSKLIYEDEALKVYFDDKEYYGISQITSSDYLISRSSKDIIFAEYYDNIKSVIIYALLAFFIIFIVFYYILFKTSKQHLSIAHKRGDSYKELAHTDILTDCYNRAYLQYWNDNTRNYDKEYLVLVIDINRLKYINDSFGHIEGDKAICYVARAFKESLRDDDIIIRLGGDEFLILVDDISSNVADDIIKRAIDKLEKFIKNIGFEIEFSIGHSVLHINSDLTEAIEKADKLMYQDKKNKHFD